MFNQALYNQEKSLKFQMSSMEKTLLNPLISFTSRPRPKTAVSYKDEFDERGKSARSTKSEQITQYYKNMTDRSAKIKSYKMTQKNLRNEAATNGAKSTTTDKDCDATLTDMSAIMMTEESGVGDVENEDQSTKKKFQVEKESVREKSKFDFSRNYETRKHSFKLATNNFNTKIEVFKP